MNQLASICLGLAALACATIAGAAPERADILRGASAYWNLADGGKGATHPLVPTGGIELNRPAEGVGAIPGSKVARLSEAYFNAGKDLAMKGDAITVYLRARDPRGLWSYGLFNKRGIHSVCNFNLFSVPLGPTPGSNIGFEMRTETGFVMVTFPVSQMDPTAWHDIVGRYDGKSIELICDGQVMQKRAWEGGKMAQNDEPVVIGAETNLGQIIRPFTGEMQEAALWSRALSDAEVARLMRKSSLTPDVSFHPPYHSPIHFRPKTGCLGDAIPFYWKGEYHVFYLHGGAPQCTWEHIVSRDLVHWKELPTALTPDGAPDGPDGGAMFTGSVTEKDGTFHIFYTGHNDNNPRGTEFVMHATSPDLIKWTKHPEDMVTPDGILYANHRTRDFRDPYVFWNEQEKLHWMVFFGNDAKTKQPAGEGVATSPDLKTWTFTPPLPAGGQECPDLFPIRDKWYLIGGSMYRWAKNIRGPYNTALSSVLDTPAIYAAKRMFDGKRHIWVGWIWDRATERDSGASQWGGTMSLPREISAGKDGQLLARPAPEVTAIFRRTVFDLRAKPTLTGAQPKWRYADGALVGEMPLAGSQCSFDAPDNYMVQCTVKLDPKAQLAIVLREQGKTGEGYRLTLRPALSEAEIAGPGFAWPRKIALDATKPITIQAFVQGTIIEAFINDQYAFTCRAYDYRSGKLGLNVMGGTVKVEGLEVKVP